MHQLQQRAQASAYGKVILCGEHAVVYGVPALALGIARGLVAKVWASVADSAGETKHSSPGAEPFAASSLTALGHRYSADPDSEQAISRAFSSLLTAAPPISEPLKVELEGELPVGVGLGYSATAGVAISRAVELAVRAKADDERVMDRAMAWERVFHGNPSGVDPAAALHGGLIRYCRPGPIRRLATPPGLELCIGLSGAVGSTHEMVARVASLRDRQPAAVQAFLDEVSEVVAAASKALAQTDGPGLGQLMDRNQQLLSAVGVSTEAIERLCELARDAGAYGAKLTGAGGGGAVIALVALGEGDIAAATRAQGVLDSWRKQGFEGFRAALTAGGESVS